MRHQLDLSVVMCKNYTAPTATAFTAVPFASAVQGAALTFAPDLITYNFVWASSTTSLTTNSFNTDEFYTMFDTNYVHCRKKMTITPDTLIYAWPTDFSTNKSFVLTLTSCDGRTIPIT